MNIIWDEDKAIKLFATRDISIEEIVQIIMDEEYIDVIENPSRPNQFLFLILYKDYIHAVPFLVDKENTIVLKTVFPSRKFHKIYGKENEKNKT